MIKLEVKDVKHGSIKNLDMDSMSIGVAIIQPIMLKVIKVSDTVRFESDRINGRLTVAKMEKAK